MPAERAPQAKLCLDPFHVVKWAGDALDQVRRQVCDDARRAGMNEHAGALKDSRYALWKNPADLTARHHAKRAMIQATDKPLHRAYLLKEQLRAVFAPGGPERVTLLDARPAWAGRSKLAPFVEPASAAKTPRATSTASGYPRAFACSRAMRFTPENDPFPEEDPELAADPVQGPREFPELVLSQNQGSPCVV